jgi:hypothetical protein
MPAARCQADGLGIVGAVTVGARQERPQEVTPGASPRCGVPESAWSPDSPKGAPWRPPESTGPRTKSFVFGRRIRAPRGRPASRRSRRERCGVNRWIPEFRKSSCCPFPVLSLREPLEAGMSIPDSGSYSGCIPAIFLAAHASSAGFCTRSGRPAERSVRVYTRWKPKPAQRFRRT